MNVTLERINIISGKRGVGKSIFCLDLVRKLECKNISVSGIISPGKFLGKKKIGILAKNISNGITTKFADYLPGWDHEKPQREWKINEDAIHWGNSILENIESCEVLIIDELGFLEFEKNMGWIKAFQVLEKDIYKIAFIIVRPELVESAMDLWTECKIIEFAPNDDRKAILKSVIDQVVTIIDK
jgi:nucleoside-triphosphatase THEP1